MKIFLSYRREDSRASTSHLYESLATRFSQDSLYKDVHNVPAGRDYRVEIERAIEDSFALIAVIGPDWTGRRDGVARIQNANDSVRIEVAQALDRGIPVFPVLVDGAKMPDPGSLPVDIKELAYRNSIILDHDTWGVDIRALIDAVTAEKTVAEKNLAEKLAERKRSESRLTGTHLLEPLVAGKRRFYLRPDIPSNKLAKVRENFALGGSSEIILLYDSSQFGSVKTGLTLGESSLTFSNHTHNMFGVWKSLCHRVDYINLDKLELEQQHERVKIHGEGPWKSLLLDDDYIRARNATDAKTLMLAIEELKRFFDNRLGL